MKIKTEARNPNPEIRKIMKKKIKSGRLKRLKRWVVRKFWLPIYKWRARRALTMFEQLNAAFIRCGAKRAERRRFFHAIFSRSSSKLLGEIESFFK